MTGSPLETPRPLDGTAALGRRAVGRRTIVEVAGEIDMATAPALSAAIGEALAAGALELWIDLTPTGFMDSAGVHALLTAQTQVRGLNRRLAIICPRGRIRRLFEFAGVSGRLPIYDDRAAAHRGS